MSETRLRQASEEFVDALIEAATSCGAEGEGDETGGKKSRRRKKKASRKKRGPTEDDVKTVLAKVIDEYDVEGALDVLEDFDVKKASQLKPEQYADVIAAAEKYLEEDED